MATKKKKTKKPAKRIPKTQEDHLNTLIRLSEQAVGTTGDSVDQYFTAQIEKLKIELSVLRNQDAFR